MNLRTILFAISLTAACAASAHAGAIVASSPIPVALSDEYDCSVVNAGAKELGNVTVYVTRVGGDLGSGMIQTCPALAPYALCRADSSAASPEARFCSIVVEGGSAKSVRGTFCNRTTGQCVDVR